jgi:hypothetical protein
MKGYCNPRVRQTDFAWLARATESILNSGEPTLFTAIMHVVAWAVTVTMLTRLTVTTGDHQRDLP